jgi:hypothetical protein
VRVGVGVGVGVRVGVGVGVGVWVGLGVNVGVAVGVSEAVNVGIGVWLGVKVGLGVRASSNSTGSAAKSTSQRTSARAIHANPSSRRIRIHSVLASRPTGSTSSPSKTRPSTGKFKPGPARSRAPFSPADTQFPSGVLVARNGVTSRSRVGVRLSMSKMGSSSMFTAQNARSRRTHPNPRL